MIDDQESKRHAIRTSSLANKMELGGVICERTGNTSLSTFCESSDELESELQLRKYNERGHLPQIKILQSR